MKRPPELLGKVLAAAAFTAWMVSWGMGLYFVQTLPQSPDPRTGRVYELRKSDRPVYMTGMERGVLYGLQVVSA